MTTIAIKNHIATKNIPKKIYSLTEYLEREVLTNTNFITDKFVKCPEEMHDIVKLQ